MAVAALIADIALTSDGQAGQTKLCCQLGGPAQFGYYPVFRQAAAWPLFFIKRKRVAAAEPQANPTWQRPGISRAPYSARFSSCFDSNRGRRGNFVGLV